MDSESSSTTQYKQETVDVPEDRLAEFHAFVARFLAGGHGHRPRGRRGRPHGRHGHGHRCGERHEGSVETESTSAPVEV